MRIIPIAVILILTFAVPALAASTSAKMTGQDQNATGPSQHRSQSSKMRAAHPGGAMSKQQPHSPGAEAQ